MSVSELSSSLTSKKNLAFSVEPLNKFSIVGKAISLLFQVFVLKTPMKTIIQFAYGSLKVELETVILKHHLYRKKEFLLRCESNATGITK